MDIISMLLVMGFDEFRSEFLSEKKWISIYNNWRNKFENVELEEAHLMLALVHINDSSV